MNTDEKDKVRYQVRTLENALDFLERETANMQSERSRIFEFVEAMKLLDNQFPSDDNTLTDITSATSRMVDRLNTLESKLEPLERDCKALEESTQKLRELTGLNDPDDIDEIPF